MFTYLLIIYPWEFTLILHLKRCLLWSQGLFELLKKNMEQRREFVPAKSRGDSISPSVLFPQLLCDISPCEQWVFAIFRTIILAQLWLSSVTPRAGLGHTQWALVPRELYHVYAHQSCPSLHLNWYEITIHMKSALCITISLNLRFLLHNWYQI